jgi:hypothetical protein
VFPDIAVAMTDIEASWASGEAGVQKTSHILGGKSPIYPATLAFNEIRPWHVSNPAKSPPSDYKIL